MTMAYCGFSDSSSDDDNEDDDLNENSNINTNTNTNTNNNQQETHNEEEDDWLTSKPQPIELTEEEKKAERKAKRKAALPFNNILPPKSLKDMKQQIYSKETADNTCNGPPPLQSLNDITVREYNRNTGRYKIKRKRRSNLTIDEHIPKSKHPWYQHPTITGVSAQVSVGIQTTECPYFCPAKIKLSEVIHLLRNVEYKPEEFVAIRMRLKNPSITVTIFSNGKLTTQGGKSEYSCTVALRKVARMLQNLEDYKDVITDINSPSFYGIQSNAHLGHRVDLEAMSEAFPNRIEYSPDLESAYLKFREPLKYGDKGSCHVYHGGRVTILGCHAVKQCIIWLEDMYIHCKPFFIDQEKMNLDEKEEENNQLFGDMFGINNNDNDDNNCFNSIAPPPLFDGIAPPPLLT